MKNSDLQISLGIVIPYFKVLYFEQTLESLAQQTDKRFRVYIGSDGSPEDPLDIINRYSSSLDITYKEFDHIGYNHLSQHWDRCLSMTKNEEWIQILGDDDTIAPNFVESIYKIIDQDIDTNVILTKPIICNKFCESKGLLSFYNKSGIYNSKTRYIQKFLKLTTISLSVQVFRKDIYNELGFRDFPVAFGTDDVLFLEFTRFKNYYYNADSHVNVRISPEHLSSTDDEVIRQKRIEGVIQARSYIIENYYHEFSRIQKWIMFLDLCFRERRVTHIFSHLFYFVPSFIHRRNVNSITDTLAE